MNKALLILTKLSKVAITIMGIVIIAISINACSLSFTGTKIQSTEFVGREYMSREGDVYVSFYSTTGAFYRSDTVNATFSLSEDNGFLSLSSEDQEIKLLSLDDIRLYSLHDRVMLFLEVDDE